MSPWPLAVDLDGTVILGDVSVAAAMRLAQRAPWRLAALAPLLGLGRARFKAGLARLEGAPGMALRADFLAWLRAQAAQGRSLHLITGADQAYAEAIAAPLGLFDTIEGSDGAVNLVGKVKAARLQARFPEGFSYAGDSAKDLAVFARARSIVLVGARPAVAAAARRRGRPGGAVFACGRRGGGGARISTSATCPGFTNL
jgi:phosphoserine phosphatase